MSVRKKMEMSKWNIDEFIKKQDEDLQEQKMSI